MASVTALPPPVNGRVDRAGRLIAADQPLEALQCAAGAAIGGILALPQLAAIARLAFRLGVALERGALVASDDRDIDMWVRAEPQGDEVALTLERWSERPAAPARLHLQGQGPIDIEPSAPDYSWSTDPELRVTELSPRLARFLTIEPEEAKGVALTRLVQLIEGEDGEMPLMSALSARRRFAGQRARARSGSGVEFLLQGDVVLDPEGDFRGFEGHARLDGAGAADVAPPTAQERSILDMPLDEVLRAPLDRIVAGAEQISSRSEGPLRGEYASYGNDIAAAARHLLSVLEAMGGDPGFGHGRIDLAGLAAETLMLVEPIAQSRGVRLSLEADRSIPANGEERAVIQILVNLVTNALRHAPPGSEVSLAFDSANGRSSVSVTDQGPGIRATDRQRIFEKFERGDESPGSAGLGLPIARRLARSMGGDVTLDQSHGGGARFSLTLPSA